MDKEEWFLIKSLFIKNMLEEINSKTVLSPALKVIAEKRLPEFIDKQLTRQMTAFLNFGLSDVIFKSFDTEQNIIVLEITHLKGESGEFTEEREISIDSFLTALRDVVADSMKVKRTK